MLNQLNEARYVFHLFPSFDGSFVAIRITKEANAQCDQIRQFLKLLVTSFITKVAKNSVQFLGHFEKQYIKLKTAVVTLWAMLRSIGATFYFNIWSHCKCFKRTKERKTETKQNKPKLCSSSH